MKSDVISLSTAGEGFRAAEEETQKVVEYERLDARQALHLQLITQEMLTLVNSVTHQTQVSFWSENEGPDYEIHVATKAALNKEERAQLISAASSRKNEAAGTFLGYLQGPKLWARTEEAMKQGRRRAKANARMRKKWVPQPKKPEI